MSEPYQSSPAEILQIEDLKRLIINPVEPWLSTETGVGNQKAFDYAKTYLDISETHAQERISDNGTKRTRTYKTKFPNVFYIEQAVKGNPNGDFTITGRLIVKLGEETMTNSAKAIAENGVPNLT